MRDKREGGLTFSLNQGRDWDLQRKGPIDQARHNEKVKEVIRGNIGGIIAEEAIITADDGDIVKIPIRHLELPRFKFSGKDQQQVGRGEGNPYDAFYQIGDPKLVTSILRGKKDVYPALKKFFVKEKVEGAVSRV